MVSAGCFLFGSLARGDADEASDKDVLIVYESDSSPSSRQQIKEQVTKLYQDCAFAEYTCDRLASMFAEGHLFAWHLYYEARPLHALGLGDQDFLFSKPAPYQSAWRDALNFVDLLGSCVQALERQTTSLVYEAGLAYVAIRNIGMSLSSLALPRPEFDRHVPFKVAHALRTRPPCDRAIYDLLVAARHSSQRGFVAPCIDASKLLSALSCAQDWAEEILEIVQDEKAVA